MNSPPSGGTTVVEERQVAARRDVPASRSVRASRFMMMLSATLCSFSFYASVKALAAAPSPPVAVGSFGSVIVLENGRKKPLDTYARNKLLQFSGKRRIAKQSAVTWLSRLLFDPIRGDFDKVFLINDPEVAHTLGIAPQKNRRYSYAALSGAAEAITRYYAAASKTPVENLSPFEKEIVRIYSNLIEYRTLASTFDFLEPDQGFHLSTVDSTADLPPQLTDPERFPSFFDMVQLNRFLVEHMSRIHQMHTDSLNPFDREIVRLTKHMFEISNIIDNPAPHVIPVIDKGKETWMSPWGLIDTYRSTSVNSPALQALLKIREAYLRGNQSAFDAAVVSFDTRVRSVPRKPGLPDPSLELLYNKINAFFIAKVLLGLAAIFALIALFATGRAVVTTSAIGIIFALILCTIGIVLRVLIMRHPPITNLYETFIFVAWSMMIIGIILEVLRIRPIGLLTASLAGFIFLHVAGRYAADGDTLGMLAAVLNSGFWLTTHIITISLGYAGCLGAGFIGHLFLVQRLLSPQKAGQLITISRAVYGVFAFGLLFTVIGTITGGMWADQAWGRFWGWDPKENGALLIILWGLIVFHYRLTGKIDGIGLSAGAIIAGVLVMCTWIGVNLLNTGLHSYGFTSSGAKMLFGYAGFEALFLTVFGVGMWMGKGKTSKPLAGKRK